MCLGVPGQIVQKWQDDRDLPQAKVNFGGIQKEICLLFTPEAQVGDYVMVHVGFAICRVDEAEAEHTWELLGQMGELMEIGL